MKRSGLPNKIISPSKDILVEYYLIKKLSVSQISTLLKCSQNKINYWLSKYKIEKRSISEAIYHLKNPLGDPFSSKDVATLEEGILFGMGLGLYWGEGSKRGKGGVRLTNTDPKLIKKFIEFLEIFFNVEKSKLRFSIQIFNDINPQEALKYWKKFLHVKESQFYKVIISKVRGEGTYKFKSKYGVIIVYFNNIKLKRLLCTMIENIQ